MDDRCPRRSVSRRCGCACLALALALGIAACAPLVASSRETVYSLPKYGVDRFIRVRGYTIHYVEAGAGVPVLLIPGAFTTYRAWNRVLPGLAVACKVLAVDYVGVGDSDKPESGFRYTVEEQADVLAEMIRSLDLSKVYVVGASYGGTVALNLAARYSGLVDKAVSIEGGAIITPEVLNYSGLGSLLSWPVLGDIIWGFMQSGLFDETTAQSIMGAAWDGLTSEERQEIIEVVRANIRTATKSSWLGIYHAITGRIDLTSALERTPVRALYLYGESSKYRMVSEVNVRWFAQHMPQVEIVPFRGGIHDLHLQFPHAVAAAILGFLGSEPGEGVIAGAVGRSRGPARKALRSVAD
jgi:pimeloyl-ACP methyl ester carboxylesterase